jgi:hypothetical protein
MAGGRSARRWRAKELLRAVIPLSPNRTRVATTGHQIRRAFEAFFVFCGTIGASVAEIVTLAQTVSTWRTEIAHGVLTGHSNAAAEGVNRLVKLDYRGAFGFTHVPHQQRRSRYAASRSTRPEWLRTVTAPASLSVAPLITRSGQMRRAAIRPYLGQPSRPTVASITAGFSLRGLRVAGESAGFRWLRKGDSRSFGRSWASGV